MRRVVAHNSIGWTGVTVPCFHHMVSLPSFSIHLDSSGNNERSRENPKTVGIGNPIAKRVFLS